MKNPQPTLPGLCCQSCSNFWDEWPDLPAGMCKAFNKTGRLYIHYLDARCKHFCPARGSSPGAARGRSAFTVRGDTDRRRGREAERQSVPTPPADGF